MGVHIVIDKKVKKKKSITMQICEIDTNSAEGWGVEVGKTHKKYDYTAQTDRRAPVCVYGCVSLL